MQTVWHVRYTLPEPERLRPLVVIAHGYQSRGVDEQVGSYLGYRWLAHHLASWGAVVFSIDMEAVNLQTGASLQQSARADVVLAAIDALMADSMLRGHIDRNRIGLVGHSMGGKLTVLTTAVDGRVKAAAPSWKLRMRAQASARHTASDSSTCSIRGEATAWGSDSPW